MNKGKLGEYLDVTRGTTLPGSNYAEQGTLIRLTLGNFYEEGGFKYNTSKTNIYYVGKVKNEYILQKDDIITPLTEQSRGLLGATARIPESNKYIQSQDIGLIKCKPGKLAESFCYYLLSSSMVRRQLSAGAQQTKIRHTSPDKIKDVVVIIPEYDKQVKIGTLLDFLTKKIELNNKINEKLEKVAETLYNYWFVQFDFPDENKRPYKSSGGKMVYNEVLKREIPANWEVKHVQDFVDVITGKEDANFSDPNGQYNFFTCGDEVLKCNKFAFCGKSVLIAGNGNFNIKYFDGKFNAYQRTYVLQPKDAQYIGIIYWSAVHRIQAFTRGSSGSIVKFITKGDVENIPLLLPNNNHLLNIFNSLLDQQNYLRNETERLTSLRDFLLPMLMNGQVTINS